MLAASLQVEDLIRKNGQARKEPGSIPCGDSKNYTRFHQMHFSQIVPLLFAKLYQATMGPCALHLILSVNHVF